MSVLGSCDGVEVRFDDFHFESLVAENVETSARIIGTRAGGYGPSPDLPPARNFDLLGRYLGTPDYYAQATFHELEAQHNEYEC